MITGVFRPSARASPRICKPSRPGRLRSSSTASGRLARHSASALSPSPQVSTCMPRRSSVRCSVASMVGLSSISSSFMLGRLSAGRDLGVSPYPGDSRMTATDRKITSVDQPPSETTHASRYLYQIPGRHGRCRCPAEPGLGRWRQRQDDDPRQPGRWLGRHGPRPGRGPARRQGGRLRDLRKQGRRRRCHRSGAVLQRRQGRPERHHGDGRRHAGAASSPASRRCRSRK